MTSTIALLSSSRRDGNTAQLLNGLKHQWPMDVVFLDDYKIGDYQYDHNNEHDDFHRLMDTVLQYNNIIFASPIYWYATTPKMKAFFDRICDVLNQEELHAQGRQLRGKKAYLVSTSHSSNVAAPFLDMFKQTFTYLGMKFGGSLHGDYSNSVTKEFESQLIADFMKKPPTFMATLRTLLSVSDR